MASKKNKLLLLLATINIFAFVIIMILFWMLWNNKSIQPDQNITVSYLPTHQPQVATSPTPENSTNAPVKTKPSVNAEDISKINAVAKEVMSNSQDTFERLDMKVPKISNKTNGSNGRTKSSTLTDEEYIAIFNQLNKKDKVAKKEYSEEEASSLPINRVYREEDDRYNKVDVSHLKSNKQKRLSLAQQVTAIATIEKNTLHDSMEERSSWQEYLRSLDEEGKERQNEMRTITVQQDDTLWNIADRAYGSGFLYKKIFEANPHLTSPNSITVGETLRVPL